MVSGTTWPDGDPFLQRQNEPSIAVSSRNPQHLVAGANDYRTVDLAIAIQNADPDAKVTGDAWLGLFKSVDGGQTWRSTLLPGCPYAVAPCSDSTAAGKGASRLGLQAGSDPVVRAGSNGMFYYSGLMFDRNHGRSAVVVSRLIDDNNLEFAGADPIRYLDNKIVAQGDETHFLDKPWIAVDIPRAGAKACSISASGTGPAQSFPAGTVYIAWTSFDSNDASSQIFFSKSGDCGATWDTPKQLSQGNSANQGASISIDPSGNVYVAWRQAQLNVLSVIADDFTRPAGVSNPATFTASYRGFAGHDTIATAISGAPAITTAADALSPPGTYPLLITQGTLSAPDYLLNFVNGTLTVAETNTGPPSGTNCNGNYKGIFTGDLTVTNGQKCVLVGGAVNGNVTQTGGELQLIGTIVSGNVAVKGGGTFAFNSFAGVSLLAPGEIHGALTVQDLPSSPAANRVCGIVIGGAVTYANNNATIETGKATAECPVNTIAGDLSLQGNSGVIVIGGNQLLSNFTAQNNTGSTSVYGNRINGTMSCSGNKGSFTGSGNIAKAKQGDCAGF